jgi:hypothetical protein
MTLETKQRSRGEVEEDYDSRTDEIVDATVMRVTGAGHLVVYPVGGMGDVRVGNPVRVIVPGKGVRPYLALEVREEHVSSPFSSNWAIIVSGHESIEKCQVSFNGVPLSTIDHLGHATTELRLPRDGALAFHIPANMELDRAYLVEVRDGDRLLRSEPLGEVRGMRPLQPET